MNVIAKPWLKFYLQYMLRRTIFCVLVVLMVYCIVCAIAAFTNVGLLCIYPFSCKAASVFNKLTYFLTAQLRSVRCICLAVWVAVSLTLSVSECHSDEIRRCRDPSGRQWSTHTASRQFAINISVSTCYVAVLTDASHRRRPPAIMNTLIQW